MVILGESESTCGMEQDLHTPPLSSSLRAFFAAIPCEARRPPSSPHTPLLDATLAEADSTGVDYTTDSHSHKMLLVAYNCIALTVPDHPIEIQVYIAIYTWLSFIIDDKTDSMRTDVDNFQPRFYSGQPQPTPLLRAYAQKLRDAYKYYDPIIAAFIVTSSLSFINACLLETRREYQSMLATKGGEKWPYYFREKEGICDAYAYFNFPKVLCPDISEFLQAIPEIGIFINLGNDVMSFYKEEMASETNNFIHKRARCEQKPASQVLNDVAKEAIAAFNRASLVLQGKGIYERCWLNYASGYLAMHKSQPRWRLNELQL